MLRLRDFYCNFVIFYYIFSFLVLLYSGVWIYWNLVGFIFFIYLNLFGFI